MLTNIRTGNLERFLKTAALYILLVFGGMWHILEWFETTMKVMAAPLIMGIGLWLFFENYIILDESRLKVRFIQWGLSVVIITIIIEWAGVQTGIIFGEYNYTHTLPPYIGGVPLAIGFAWLGMLLSSLALSQRIFSHFYNKNIITAALMAGFLMTIFDAFMEPAAVALNYWNWTGEIIPLQNYATWFIISTVLSYAGLRAGLFKNKLSSLGIHAYFAQLIYFVLVYFS